MDGERRGWIFDAGNASYVKIIRRTRTNIVSGHKAGAWQTLCRSFGLDLKPLVYDMLSASLEMADRIGEELLIILSTP